MVLKEFIMTYFVIVCAVSGGLIGFLLAIIIHIRDEESENIEE